MAYFRKLKVKVASEAAAHHREKRIAEIRSEILSLDIAQLCTGLTPSGVAFAREWYNMSVDTHVAS
jgi:hypothetical protein